MKKVLDNILFFLAMIAVSALGYSAGYLLNAPKRSASEALSSYTLHQATQSLDDLINLLPPGYIDSRIDLLTKRGEYTEARAAELIEDCYDSIISDLCETDKDWADGACSVFENTTSSYTPDSAQLDELKDVLRQKYGVKGKISGAELLSYSLSVYSFSGAEYVEEDIPVLMVQVRGNWYVMNMTAGLDSDLGCFNTRDRELDWMCSWFSENCSQPIHTA